MVTVTPAFPATVCEPADQPLPESTVMAVTLLAAKTLVPLKKDAVRWHVMWVSEVQLTN